MATKRVFRRGQRIGPWRLQRLLGAGGNAEVWEATRDEETAALKILTRAGRDAYDRFRAEVDVLSDLKDEEGLLPILDRSLPATLSRTDRPWLAMPVAEPLRQALGRAPTLEKVIAAVARIARTLAKLHERGIWHRDIKPGNLYMLDETPSIGDFGLVRYPHAKSLTSNGKKLGPARFVAPEMLDNPRGADGAAVDVYELAKTLWVLITDQRYPPQGPQRRDDASVSITGYVVHPRTASLDYLFERATANTPGERITMARFAEELEAWLTPPATNTEMTDFSRFRDQAARHVEPVTRAENVVTERRRLLHHAFVVRQGRVETVAQELRANGLTTASYLSSSPVLEALLPGVIDEYGTETLGIMVTGSNDTGMAVGVIARVSATGTRLRAAYGVKTHTPNWHPIRPTWVLDANGDVGTAAFERDVEALFAAMLGPGIEMALDSFFNALEN